MTIAHLAAQEPAIEPGVRFLLWLLACITLVIGALQVAYGLRRRRDAAMLYWGLSTLVATAGYCLLSLGGLVPYFVAVAIANGVLVAPWLLVLAGLRRFTNQPGLGLWPLLPPAGVTLCVSLLAVLRDDRDARALFVALVIAVLDIAVIRETIREQRDVNLGTRRLLLVVWFLWLPVVLTGPALRNVVDPDSAMLAVVGFVALLGLFVLTVITGIGLILLGREGLEAELVASATRDFQTGALNRSGLTGLGQRLLDGARAAGQPVTVLLMDLDNFKAINDRYGHAAGDAVLTEFSHRVQAIVRDDDVFARYGGEEFCAVIQATTEAGREVAERIRGDLASRPVDVGHGVEVVATVSIGVAALSSIDQVLNEALVRADRALYRAKVRGRNRVEVAA